MAKYAQGIYQVKNPEKYVGKRLPHYRSSWERTFCNFCDNHPNVIQWASECFRIPYVNPFSGKKTTYVPDFFVVYVDAAGQKHGEIIEIKPSKEVSMETARSNRDKAYVALNHAKWQAARAFSKANGLRFRIVTESDIYFQGKAKR